MTLAWFLIGLVCIPIAAVIAQRKERRGWPWGLAAAFIGPVSVLVVALLPGGRKCPQCLHRVKPGALVCGHCGRDVPAYVRPGKPEPQTYALGESWPKPSDPSSNVES